MLQWQYMSFKKYCMVVGAVAKGSVEHGLKLNKPVKSSSKDSGSIKEDEPVQPVSKPATKVNMLIVGQHVAMMMLKLDG